MTEMGEEKYEASPSLMPSLSGADFRRLASFIESELGIRMPESKRVMLESRLAKRIRQLGFESYSKYVDYVFSESGKSSELINMIDAVTTNKTDFFREPDHFDYLLDTIIPAMSREGARSPKRFWSAGCSTGEEPYTLAMVLEEHRIRDPAFSYSIFASDLSSQVLAKAAEAVYRDEQIDPIPMSFKKKYLLRSKDRRQGLVRICPELRSKVHFSRLNFMDSQYVVDGPFEVVFCRNVIIYFERRVQEEILRKLSVHIRSGGYLMLGHSETIAGMALPIHSVAPTIYRKD